MKNLIFKVAILVPLIPIALFVIGTFIFSYIIYVIMIFKIYSKII
jgi:hypothetical protein